MAEKQHNLVTCMYSHPEAYPPTLNAINELSDCFKQIAVVHRPLLPGKWEYPENVTLFAEGTPLSELQQQQSSVPKKVMYFIRHTVLLLKIIRRYKPKVILLYDNISLYSYHLLRPLIRQPHHAWYHNHDVVEAASQRKYAIGGLALRNEKKSFDYLSVFTLPTNDRLPYFDLTRFKGKYFCVPNFPSKQVYGQYKVSTDLPAAVSLIYQGSMDNSHGIEEVIPVLKEKIAGKQLTLKLLGKSQPGYKESIEAIADTNRVKQWVQFEGLQPYKKIPEISATCHIGLAIYTKQDVMNKTISTASNKIYEYAAVGLPVICFDNEYYRNHLGKYSWIFFTDCSRESFRKTIASITERYTEISGAARHDFIHQLNFETVFKPVKDYLQSIE